MHRIFLALLLNLLYLGLVEPGCLFKDFPKKDDPLYLIESQPNIYTFLVPNRGDPEVIVDTGKYIHLVCIGTNNYLVQSRNPITVARCSGRNKFEINGAQHDLSSVSCKKRSSASVIDTRRACSGTPGTIFEIVFQLPNPYGSKKMIDVCYDKRTGLTYYTQHHLYSSTKSFKVVKESRTSFIKGPSLFFDKDYSKDNQAKVFRDLFGSYASHYFSPSNFLARGHLAPDADFMYPSWQLSTYNLINAAPQWQEINAGQWYLTVEEGIRDYAFRQKTDLEIISGTTGVLKLDDQRGTAREIFLVPNSLLPVPEYFWKIVVNFDENKCIGIIGTNNPYLNISPRLMCQNLCPQWTSSSLRTGFIYCCSYDDMRKFVTEVPSGVQCSRGRLSNFPN